MRDARILARWSAIAAALALWGLIIVAVTAW
jgi:hypothetical protein